jgi:hypothetical protein
LRDCPANLKKQIRVSGYMLNRESMSRAPVC